MTDSNQPARDASAFVRTSGRSMTPLIRGGTTVRYTAVGAADLVPGDIMVFRSEGRLLVHRLIEKKESEGGVILREKGDNQLTARWIPADALLGKAVIATHGHSRRPLDVDLSDGRIAALLRYSRFEAGVLDAYLRLKGASRLAAWIRWPFGILALLLAPFRALFYRAALRVYPREESVETGEEQAFLVRCFRSASQPEAEKGHVVASDWTVMLEAIGWHRLAPLAVKLLSGDASVPVEALKQLKQLGYRAAVYHKSALQAAAEAGAALRAAGVRHAVLKGPFLYEAFYQDRFPREYDDIDLLVASADVDRALAALERTGYEAVGPGWTRALLRRGHFHLTLQSTRPGRPPIELHWALVDRANLYRVPDAELLARAREFSAGEGSFSVLSIEDEFIYLCLHAAKHGVMNATGIRQGFPAEWFARLSVGNCLIWFMDIDLLLRREAGGMDWEAVARRAREWNVLDEVAVCLRVLQKLQPESAAAAALGKLGVPADESGGSRAGGGSAFWQSRAGRWTLEKSMTMNPALFFRPIRLLMAGRILFPPPGALLRYYGAGGSWRLPFLYLVHPFRLVRKVFAAPPAAVPDAAGAKVACLLVWPPRATMHLPLGIPFLVSHLKARGIETNVLDLNALYLKRKRLFWALLSWRVRYANAGERVYYGGATPARAAPPRWKRIALPVVRRLDAMMRAVLGALARERSIPWSLGEMIALGFDGAGEGPRRAIESILLRPLRSRRYGLVGISAAYPEQLFFALVAAKVIKEQYGRAAAVVLGGSQVTKNIEHLARSDRVAAYVDYLVAGDGEAPLAELAEGLRTGRVEDIPNLYRAVPGGTPAFVAPERSFSLSPRDYPTPDFTGFDLRQYQRRAPVLASKGCSWGRCTFCTYPLTKGCRHEAGVVDRTVAIIKEMKAKYGLAHFQFVDDELTAPFLGELAAALSREKADVAWSSSVVLSRDLGRPDRLQVLRAGGLKSVQIGLESVAPRVLALMDKIHKNLGEDEIRAILEALRAAGIGVLAHIIFGFPTETREEAQRTLEFLRRNRSLCTASIQPFSLEEHTAVFNDPARFGVTRIHTQDKDAGERLGYRYEVTEGMTQDEAAAFARDAKRQLALA